MERRRLGDILVDEAILGAETLERALQAQAASPRRRLGQLLVESGALDPSWLTAALALQAGVETVDPLVMPVDPAMLWKVPPDVAERLGVLIVHGESGPLAVTHDPSDLRSIRSLAGMLGIADLPVAAALPDRLNAAISRHYDASRSRSRRIRGVLGEQRPALTSPTAYGLDTRQMAARLARGGARAQEDFATALLVWAAETGLERLVLDAGHLYACRDGVDTPVMELPQAQALPVATRLRALVRLDTGATRAAGGEAHVALGEASVRVQARSGPGAAGGRLELGFPDTAPPAEVEINARLASAWHDLCSGPGLVLVVSPDGIPVPLPEEGRPERRTLTDWSSVDSAVRAARTGKTVVATLVAPSIAEGLARLQALAPSRTEVAAILRGAVTGCRVREVCPTCAGAAEADPLRAERLGVPAFQAPRPGTGCPDCGYVGYRGSRWCHEVVVASQALRDLLSGDAEVPELGRRAVPVGERHLRIDGAAHAVAGHTTAEELERVMHDAPAWVHRASPERARGLLRAVTDVEPEPAPEVDADDPTADGLPMVLLVHPGEQAAVTLRAGLRGRADVLSTWSVAAARSTTHPILPAVGVLAQWAAGGWDTRLLAEWHALGLRIVLLGPSGDLAQMSAAFELGADEYAGSLEELTVRLCRWLPLTGTEAGRQAR